MADNKPYKSDAATTITTVGTKEVTFSGDTTDVQLIELVAVTGSEGARTLNEISSAAGVLVDLGANNDVSLNAGTNNIGDVDVLSIAAGDNNIGNVDIVTMPNVTIGTMAALVAGTANIGDVDVLTVPAPLSTAGGGTEATALRVTIANDSTGVVSVDDNGGSLTVDGTVAVTGVATLAEQQTQTTALQLIDNAIHVDDAAFTLGTHSGVMMMGFAGTQSVNANDAGAIAMEVDGSIHIHDGGNSITVDGTVTANLAAGTNNIGDVDILSIAAGDNNIGNVDIVTMPNVTIGTMAALVAGTANIGDVDVLTINGVAPAFGSGVRGATVQRVTIATDDVVPASQSGTWTVQPGNTANTTPWLIAEATRTTGGPTTYHLVSAATANATNIKASAGQLYGWYIYNSNAAARKVAFHNSASTPTAGASIYFALVIPATSGANVFLPHGIPFSAGIGITTVTGLADSDATAVALNDLVINLWYA